MCILLLLIPAIAALSLQEISSILYGNEYKGVWRGATDKQFDYLDEMSGNSFMIFLQESTKADTTNPLIERLEFQLLNPTYPELKQAIGIFDLKPYNEASNSWVGESILNYSLSYKFKRVETSKEKCKVNMKVSVEFDDGNSKPENARINMELKSQDPKLCQLDFAIEYTYDTTPYLLEIITYCAFSVIICFGQFMCVTKLYKQLIENDQDVSKISIISVGYVTVYDSYICLQNLYYALINYSYFQYFILPAFAYFMLATTCDMKLIWVLWRARHLDQLFDQQQMRKAITIFFAQFCNLYLIIDFSLIAYFVLMYFFELNNWFLGITALLMVPQIVHNVKLGNNPKFIPAYIFGILTPSMFYSVCIIQQQVYNRGCPANLRGMQPNLLFVGVFVSLYILQILMLYIQYKLGPRSFIPKVFLPKQYQYYHTVNIQEPTDDECAICLNSIQEEPGEEGQEKLLVKRIMVTPCNHRFHISCLKSWIDVKLQCPSCRTNIPPILE